MNMIESNDKMYLAHTRRFENCTVYVYRPILTDEERERRYDSIRRMLQQIGPSIIAAEEKRKQKEMEKNEQVTNS